MREFGKLDVLVNNAAFQEHADSLEDLTDERLEETLHTNVIGYFHMAQGGAAAPEEGRRRSSTPARSPASKAARSCSTTRRPRARSTRSRSRSRSNLLDKGIRVNAVAPGPVWTPLNPADSPADQVAKFGQSTDMKRAAQPEELSPAYVFLASPVCSGYITRHRAAGDRQRRRDLSGQPRWPDNVRQPESRDPDGPQRVPPHREGQTTPQKAERRADQAPHERDESSASQQQDEPSELMKQARDDVERGLVDTSRAEATDATYRRELRSEPQAHGATRTLAPARTAASTPAVCPAGRRSPARRRRGSRASPAPEPIAASRCETRDADTAAPADAPSMRAWALPY